MSPSPATRIPARIAEHRISRRGFGALLAAAGAGAAVAGCGGGSSATGSQAVVTPPADPTKVTGDITVLTNRTDLNQDGTLAKYAAAFNKVYPDVKVTFQAITDYEGEVKIRMNTENYGDVLLIPPSITMPTFPRYFSPLGTAADLSDKYQWTDTTTVDGKVYGLATFGNANGFIYNKRVWKQAGITADPTTPAQFLAAMAAVKSKTKAIPYYTNYHDGWPLQGWYGALGSATCDPMASTQLATEQAPWSSGKSLDVIDTMLWDIVKGGYIEPDPSTTNWESSKAMLATGKVSAMWLGSWAVVQMQAAAKTAGADPADIGIMPFPGQKDGKFCPVTGPDYNQAINVHSKYPEAARAWLTWFTDKSGFSADNGALSPLQGQPLPDTLADYQAAGVSFIELSTKDSGLVQQIDNQSEIGVTSSPTSLQKLVDTARGAAGGDLASLYSGWNKSWADAIQTAS